ncbi:sulfatase family protein [Anaerocolumna sp. MB42-C2]|uniref:sulfatase family protein n=1 Tax=Anaerocolumna sp. MB42-C2 TaxID=3070997 RepID=UPI0027DF6FB9|nr:sulfatase-like hydrolase/transferase [Anaerocolumna sp. MB42-C2]WMJ89751.1 sulfatase-like hydrolase/transferase [Anaerocolumna sp. MB42-C2]
MESQNAKPNIIIVMSDQQRADLRKSNGYCLDTMPFLDSWSCGGVDFNRAYTPNPTCMPARVSMFTGRYAECHKVRTNHNAIDALYSKDLLDVFKENGYQTALCGKNHSHHAPDDFDFHEMTGHLGYEGEINTSKEEIEFADFLLNTKHMETDIPSPGGLEVQHPYRNVSSALKFIDQADREVPFFAWVSFAEPHNPYQVPEPYFNMFPPESLPPTAGTEKNLDEKGVRFRWLRDRWEDVLGDNINERILRCRSNYHGMLRLIDDQLKRLIEGLRERDLEKNTIVIYVSDHGDFVGEYGLIRKGADLPDILTHIPFVWRGPDIVPQGKQTNSFVSLVDILPTLCDIIGAKIPFGCQGKSILPILTNKEIPDKEFDCAYSESGFSGLYWNEKDALTLEAEGASQNMVTFDCLNTWTQCGQVRMLRKGDYRIQLDMMGTGYLYNVKEDPGELVNLWDNPDYFNLKTDMLTELTAAILRACDPLPVPHNRYRTKIHPKGYWFQPYASEDMGVRNTGSLTNMLNHMEPKKS